MNFVPIAEAAGAILAHSVKIGVQRFKKGSVLGELPAWRRALHRLWALGLLLVCAPAGAETYGVLYPEVGGPQRALFGERKKPGELRRFLVLLWLGAKPRIPLVECLAEFPIENARSDLKEMVGTARTPVVLYK